MSHKKDARLKWVNKAIHVLLMHRFGTLKYACSRPLLFMTTDLFVAFIYLAWPWEANINVNVQPPVECEMATKNSALLFVNLSECIIEFMH